MCIGSNGTVHLTTPGLRDGELSELAELCDHVSFNSLSQLRRMAGSFEKPDQIGLRLNPQLSLVSDERYDPCRPQSKLGVPLDAARTALEARARAVRASLGTALSQQLRLDDLRAAPSHGDAPRSRARRSALASLSWINLGGGYLLDEPEGDRSPRPSGRATSIASRPQRVLRARRGPGSQGGVPRRVGDRHVPLRRQDNRRARHHGQPRSRSVRVPVRARRARPRRRGRL